MRAIARSIAVLAAPVALSITMAAAPVSTVPAAGASPAAAKTAAMQWVFWQSYASSRTCNNTGALGVLGGAWSDYTCSYVPVDDQPYWLFVNL
jgi:hypothetical protein